MSENLDRLKRDIQRILKKINKVADLNLELNIDTIVNPDKTLKELKQIYEIYSANNDTDTLVRRIVLGEDTFANLENKLSIKNNISRCLFLIKASPKIDDIILEILSELLSSGENIIIKLSKDKILILHTLSIKENEHEIRDLAHNISDNINTEAMLNISICYGKSFKSLEELQDKFKDISLAMEVANIFYSHKKIISESDLGIAPLIYSLPTAVCEKFLKNIFKDKVYVDIDKETMQTINIFFSNNLNIAETSRKLHMHRNTLVYRLEQIEAKTGIEIRSFEGALTFNIASMLINYLKQKGEIL